MKFIFGILTCYFIFQALTELSTLLLNNVWSNATGINILLAFGFGIMTFQKKYTTR